MGLQALKWAWEQEVVYAEKLVLLALADHANNQNECWPGQEFLSKKTGLGRTRISRLLSSLKRKNLVEIRQRRFKGLRRSNVYTLVIKKEPCAPTTHGNVLPQHTTSEIMCSQSTIEPSLKEEPSIGSLGFAKPEPPENWKTDSGEEIPMAGVDDKIAGMSDPTLDEVVQVSIKEHKIGKLSAARMWSRMYRATLHESDWLTGKEKGQLKLLYEKEGVRMAAAMEAVFRDWIGFTSKATNEAGAFKTPNKPAVWFFVKFFAQALAMGEGYLGGGNLPKVKTVQLTAQKESLTNAKYEETITTSATKEQEDVPHPYDGLTAKEILKLLKK